MHQHRSPFASSRSKKISNPTRITAVLALAALHPILIYLLFPIFGEAVNLLVIIAPVAATLMFRFWAGALLVFINAISTALMFSSLAQMPAAEGNIKALAVIAVNLAICYGAERLRRYIEQRRIMTEELNQAKKMEAIGRLAGGVAHDMNNTLNAIMGSVFALRQELSPYNRRFKDLDNIAAACDRGAQLTQNLLGFARKSNYKKQIFPLNAVVESVQSLLARTTNKDIRILTHITPENPLMEGERSQVENAVMNLCINALDAMTDRGVLTITTHADEQETTIGVSDTGTGMDEAVRERVFEPFFTTKAEGKGTGLGLSMVYGVVHAMNGRINLESTPGKGTKVMLTFPRAERSAQETNDVSSIVPETPDEHHFLSGRTVLIIDDEPLVLRSSCRMLSSLGCEVLSAATGQDGVTLFKAHRHAISLAIIDLIMPVMDGIATLEAIMEEDESVPVLMVSGYTRESEKMDAVKNRQTTVRFLSKPYNASQLISAAKTVLAPRTPSNLSETNRSV